ncbi:MAG: hypothetical protein ACRDQJ_09645 [Pseudonocardiaceae bacterium]
MRGLGWGPMFVEGNRELLDWRRSLDLDADPVVTLRQSARQFVDFWDSGPDRRCRAGPAARDRATRPLLRETCKEN